MSSLRRENRAAAKTQRNNTVMNVKNTKIPQPRFVTAYNGRYRMKMYGSDNLYPQHVQRITEASGTASLCLSRYTKFVEGNGFRGDAFANYMANDEETFDDVLKQIASDVCHFGGFALHVNYNVLGEVTDMRHVPFENCRLSEPDDRGYVADILVHEDWTGEKTVNGRKVTITEEHIEKFPVFDSRKEIVFAQIQAAGGIDGYTGQILWCSIDGKNTYPTPIYDAAITDISTDEGIGNVKYRSTRNNFLIPCMMVTKKGVPNVENGREQHMIEAEDLRDFQGDENTGKIMLVELENDEDEPKIVEFPTKNFDKDFEVTDASTVERIYAQFHQELFYAIRIGKLGFSGTVMKDAYEYYAGEVTNEQRFIERGIRKVLSVWHDEILRNADCSIEPMRYINSEAQQ